MTMLQGSPDAALQALAAASPDGTAATLVGGRPRTQGPARAALGRTLATYAAIGDALALERTALLEGNARGLETAIARLKVLVGEARNHDALLRAALSRGEGEGETRDGPGAPGEDDVASARAALARAAANVRLLALRNAQLLVRARDLTRRLTAVLEQAGPKLDRRA